VAQSHFRLVADAQGVNAISNGVGAADEGLLCNDPPCRSDSDIGRSGGMLK